MKKNFEDILQKIEKYRIQYNNSLRDILIEDIYNQTDIILKDVVNYKKSNDKLMQIEKYMDLFLTSPVGGFLTLIVMLTTVLWITISGAGYISSFLSSFFEILGNYLKNLMILFKAPEIVISFLVDGVYRAVSFVVAVMFPPMAIFFPLFTLLEDWGLLPRVALNMDRIFKVVGAHGNQALTMMVGFGCNAAGVISTRIIKSPKERLIAILTNNFIPCNGRWPLLIMISVLFIAPILSTSTNTLLTSIISSLSLVLAVSIGIFFTLLISFGLSRTLKSLGSFYILEIPPFRKPNILRVLYTSFIDRTIFVLARAVKMSIPAGIFIWTINYFGISKDLINFFDSFGKIFGLDGVIILTYIIALPANEIVIPAMLMLYANTKELLDIEELNSIYQILTVYGNWDWKTAINVMLFSILHNPCTTTLLSIYNETKSIKWTVLSFILPLLTAFSTLFILNHFVFKFI
ncbi:MAG: nucleoside recognition domain-containing protein [bacterium]